MRLLATADLHYNHAKSRATADELIARVNAMADAFDVLLVAGDVADGDSDFLERCLRQFTFPGPKLYAAGNHDLWTQTDDSRPILRQKLPERLNKLGWHDLQQAPYVFDDAAVVGTVGWYDYAYAVNALGIPRRFYEHKLSPGAAEARQSHHHLLGDDVPAHARGVFARWNDGRFVKLHMSDDAFLEHLLEELHRHLFAVSHKRTVVAVSHHVPLKCLLPPRAPGPQWDFARAFLGSPKIGEAMLRYENVGHILCGHSHHAVYAEEQGRTAINIGGGYRNKEYVLVEA
ncbi:MAG: metallophosphoesterase [Phycisphaerae bacterium]